MRTKKEILEGISKLTSSYKEVLNCGPATVDINAPRALMQLAAISQLNALYWTLGKNRPKFTCDDDTKINQ